MQTIFEKEVFESTVSRFKRISENTKPIWGKMNASQMLHHLNLAIEVPLGKTQAKSRPNFITKLFKRAAYSDKPFGKNSPTPKDFKVTDSNLNFNDELQKLINNLNEIFYKGVSSTYLPHVFFGEITSEQWGKHFYKHADHHLKQFGV
ncbi:MAG TPA: DUF1569 domain-containing protein [Flavisolibacter sp.]|nr:DUF1569 domain-containing protein [Flavisolibacter sp.]